MRFVDRLLLIGKPSQTEFNSALQANPDKAFELLAEHTAHRSYQALSQRIPKSTDRFSYEWIINPYQYVRQVLPDDRMLEFAGVLEHSAVWCNAAPHFVDSSVWTRVIETMLERCPETDKTAMIIGLNRYGLLEQCLIENAITSESAQRRWGINPMEFGLT